MATVLGGGVLIWEAVNRARRLGGDSYAEELRKVVALARRTGWRRVWAMSALVLLLAATAAAIAAGLRGRALEAVVAASVGAYGLLSLGVNLQVHRERMHVAREVKAVLNTRR